MRFLRRRGQFDGADYTIRLDVEAFDRQGPYLALRLKTHLISLSGNDSFTHNRALFSGDTLYTDEIGVELRDHQAGRLLDIVVDGEGRCLCTYPDTTIYEGGSATSWFLMTAPKGYRETLDIYVPAFGVLQDVPVS